MALAARFASPLISLFALTSVGLPANAWAQETLLVTNDGGHLHFAPSECAPLSSVSTPTPSADERTLADALCILNHDGGGTVTLALNGEKLVRLHLPLSTLYGPAGLPTIESAIILEGGGATLMSAENLGADPAERGRIFNVAVSGKLTLRDLSLTNGLARGNDAPTVGGAGMGGAIYNAGELVLERVALYGNTALGGNRGPSAPAGPLTNPMNDVVGGGFGSGGGGAGLGGALFNQGGKVTLTNVTFHANAANGGLGSEGAMASGSGIGSAIFNLNGELSLDFVTAATNTSSGGNLAKPAEGGGPGTALFSLANGSNLVTGRAEGSLVTVKRSLFSGNTDGAGRTLVDVASSWLPGGMGSYTAQLISESANLGAFSSTGAPGAIRSGPEPLLGFARIATTLSTVNATTGVPTLRLDRASAARRAARCNEGELEADLVDARGRSRPTEPSEQPELMGCDLGAFQYQPLGAVGFPTKPLYRGQMVTLSATPALADDLLQCTSSDPGKAVVSARILTAVGAGSVTITCNDEAGTAKELTILDCATDEECGEAFYCTEGRCAAKIARGSTCDTDRTCVTGFCVDGRCCNSRCAGSCSACDIYGSTGICTPVGRNETPHGERPRCRTQLTIGQLEEGQLPDRCEGWCDGASFDCVHPVETCAPFGCAMATPTSEGEAPEPLCKEKCASDDDCATDAECVESTCYAVAPKIIKKVEESGCGCGVGGSPSASFAGTLLLVLFALGRLAIGRARA